jgi:hypothetical protein
MVDPSKFGEDHDAVWKRGRTIEETGRIAAAYAQHLAAIVRVLKRVLRSVDRDEVVRGDVYADSVSEDAEASATLPSRTDGQ